MGDEIDGSGGKILRTFAINFATKVKKGVNNIKKHLPGIEMKGSLPKNVGKVLNVVR